MLFKSCPIHKTALSLGPFDSYYCESCNDKVEKFTAAFHEKEMERLYGAEEASLKDEFWEESETSAKPTRYNKPGASLEVWDAIEQLGLNYMQGNILKYTYRYQEKNGPEDLVKAINYIVKMISQETGEDYYELHKLTPEELAKRIKKCT